MSDHVLVSQAAGVLRIQLNRADKKNALTRAMYTALAAALEGAEANPDIRVITITGVGDVFTSGNDFKDFLDGRSRRPTVRSCASCPRSPEPASP